ncbi:MAG: Mu transposase domain-containing protein [Leptolyngbya sp. IPPAS B-1204]
MQEVERQVLAPLRHEQFSTLTDLNAAIAQRLKALNERTMHGYRVSRRVLFEQVDQPALTPLPSQAFTLPTGSKPRSTWTITSRSKTLLPVPYWFVQHEVRVKMSEQMVEIFHDGKRIAAHERCRLPHRHTTLPDHMPPEHWAYKRQSKERF